jgi:hypothetical protein
MSDQLTLHNGKAVITTEEGQKLERPEALFMDMLRREFLPPLDGTAFPDGIKFIDWRDPYLLVVHQQPPHCRQVRWITDHSLQPFGPGTTYRKVRLSLPYSITFALYFLHGQGLFLSAANELYFRNEPLRSRNDRLGYPALLNISRIDTPNRQRSWICTQYLQFPPKADWIAQLHALLEHTWNGGFNRSSEHHEGASWYGVSKGIHPDLHPVEKWQAASANDAFALSVPWKPADFSVGELMNALFQENADGAAFHLARPRAKRPASLVQRFLNFAQKG